MNQDYVNSSENDLEEDLVSEVTKILEVAFGEDSIIELSDFVGDGNHWSLSIKSDKFKGKSEIDRHRMIYKSLGDMVGARLHALTIKTSTNFDK